LAFFYFLLFSFIFFEAPFIFVEALSASLERALVRVRLTASPATDKAAVRSRIGGCL
jgi:hypothetical protein